MSAPVLVFLVLAASGLALLAIGLRGRRADRALRCRRCSRILSDPAPSTCPNCAADLARRKAVRRGGRRPVQPLVGLGAALLLVISLLGGSSAWLNSFRFDWNQLKPDMLLAREATGADQDRSVAAAATLLERVTEGDIERSRLEPVIDRALSIQANPEREWSVVWGDLIEAAWDRNWLTDAQIDQYLANAARFAEFEIAGSDEIGGGVAFQYRIACRTAAVSRLSVAARVARVRIDGARTEAEYTALSFEQPRFNQGRRGIGYGDSYFRGPSQTVEARLETHVIETDALPEFDRVLAYGVGEAEPLAPSHHVHVERVKETIELDNPHNPPLPARADPALSSAIKQAISARCVVTLQTMTLHITFGELPVPVAFDVLVKPNDAKGESAAPYRFGAVAHSPDAPSPRVRAIEARRYESPTLPPHSPTCTLILRANPWAFVEEEHAAIYEALGNSAPIWDGEIALENVPVEWHEGDAE